MTREIDPDVSPLKQDTRLREIVEHHGARNWRMVAEQLGTPRSDVQCLHRYIIPSLYHMAIWNINGFSSYCTP